MKIFHLSTPKDEIFILYLIEKVQYLHVEYAIVGVRLLLKKRIVELKNQSYSSKRVGYMSLWFDLMGFPSEPVGVHCELP